MFKIDDIKLLYKKAEGHNLYYDEINEETRKVEAFLIQSALLEGVLCEIAFKTMGTKFPRVYGKRKNRYGLNSVIDDLYLLKVISDNEFNNLEKFKNARNKYFHTLLKHDPKKLENQLGDEYGNFEEIIWGMVKKLEKLYKK
jgi:predicted MPP superfamily phosphohydrolase